MLVVNDSSQNIKKIQLQKKDNNDNKKNKKTTTPCGYLFVYVEPNISNISKCKTKNYATFYQQIYIGHTGAVPHESFSKHRCDITNKQYRIRD